MFLWCKYDLWDSRRYIPILLDRQVYTKICWNPQILFVYYGMSNKTCRKCSGDLVIGENISLNRLNHSDYICNKCSRIGYVPTGNPKGRAPIYKDPEEVKKAHKRANQKERKLKNILFPPGVYGIFRNHELVYVGESKGMWARIYGGHFKYNKQQQVQKHKISNIDEHITKDNIDEWSWAYLAKDDDLNQRLIIESQYVCRHAPELNSPYNKLPPNELKSLHVALEQCDLGKYTLEDLEYYPANKTKLVPDGVYIKRIVKY